MTPLDLLVYEGVEVGDVGLEVFVQLGEARGRLDVSEIDFDARNDLLLWCLCGETE